MGPYFIPCFLPLLEPCPHDLEINADVALPVEFSLICSVRYLHAAILLWRAGINEVVGQSKLSAGSIKFLEERGTIISLDSFYLEIKLSETRMEEIPAAP